MSMLAAALDMWEVGIVPLPVKADGSKRPAVDTWKSYADGTEQVTEEDLQRWFRNSRQGLGAVMGAASGGLEMLEVEGDASPKFGAIKGAMDDHGLGEVWQRITDGYTELTPKGGYHWLYRLADGVVPGNKKIAERQSTTTPNGRDTLAETRGQGGYVVVAPTPGTCHVTGRPWELKRGGISTIATITMVERNAIHAVLRMVLDEMPKQVAQSWAPRGASDVGDQPGDIFNAHTSWAELLPADGWTLVVDRGGAQSWRRPGKDIGVSATTGHNGSENLHIFTTSTCLGAERSYDKFGYFARWHHGGDFTAAAQCCKEQGYCVEQSGTKGTTSGGRNVGIGESGTKGTTSGDDESQDWEDPTPLDGIEARGLPAFPVAMMPQPIRALAENIAATFEWVSDLACLTALAVLSTLLAIRWDVVFGEQRMPITLNLVGVARSGGIKSPSFGPMVHPVNDRQEMSADRWEAGKFLRAAELMDIKRELGSKAEMTLIQRAQLMAREADVEAEKEPILSVTETTLEGLSHEMAEQGGALGWLSDEGSLFDHACGMYSDHPNLDMLKKAFDGMPYHSKRKGAGGTVRMQRPRLTVLSMTQTSVFASMATASRLHGEGVLQRFLMAFPPPAPPMDHLAGRSISGALTDAYRVWAKTLPIDVPQGEVVYSLDAVGVINRWAQTVEDRVTLGELVAIAEWWRKAKPQVIRIGALLHLADNESGRVSVATALRAVEIGNYFVEHAKHGYAAWASTLTEHNAARVLRWLADQPLSVNAGRDLRRSFRRSLSDADLTLALNLLEDYGWIRMAPTNWSFGRGRMSPVIHRHPDFAVHFSASGATGATRPDVEVYSPVVGAIGATSNEPDPLYPVSSSWDETEF